MVLITSTTVLKMVFIPSHSPEKKSLIPFHTACAVEEMASHAAVKKFLIASHTAMATSFTFSQRLIQNCRKSSFVFHK